MKSFEQFNNDDLALMEMPFEPDEHAFYNGRPFIKKGAYRKRLTQIDRQWEIRNPTRIEGEEGVIVFAGELVLKGVVRSGVGVGKALIYDGDKKKPFNTLLSEYSKAFKSAVSDLIPRCAMEFGIGTYLKTVPRNVVDEKTLATWLNELKLQASRKPVTTTTTVTGNEPVVNQRIEDLYTGTKHLFKDRAEFDTALPDLIKDKILVAGEEISVATEKLRRHRWTRDPVLMEGFRHLLTEAGVTEDEFWSYTGKTTETFTGDTASARQLLGALKDSKAFSVIGNIEVWNDQTWSEVNLLGAEIGYGEAQVFTVIAGAAGFTSKGNKNPKKDDVEAKINPTEAKTILTKAKERLLAKSANKSAELA